MSMHCSFQWELGGCEWTDTLPVPTKGDQTWHVNGVEAFLGALTIAQSVSVLKNLKTAKRLCVCVCVWGLVCKQTLNYQCKYSTQCVKESKVFFFHFTSSFFYLQGDDDLCCG